MGMLIRRHRDRHEDAAPPKRTRKAKDEPAKSEPKAKDADKAE